MNSVLVSSIFVFILGVGVGVLLQRYVLGRSSQSAKLESQLAKLQGEHLHLKSSLEQHFHQTADLTRSLTNNYKALYEHLAKGADDFTHKPLTDLDQLLDTPKAADANIDYAAAGLDPQAIETPIEKSDPDETGAVDQPEEERKTDVTSEEYKDESPKNVGN